MKKNTLIPFASIKDIILIRHGQSAGNAANELSRNGDHRIFTKEMLGKHTAELPLTDQGITQAKSAGQWLRDNNLHNFDCHYVSEYTRAMETAALLDLPNAQWQIDPQLRERDQGLIDNVPYNLRQSLMAKYLKFRPMHQFYTRLPHGESTADVCNRLRLNIIFSLQKEQIAKRAVIVFHRHLMQAFRAIFEGLSATQYRDIEDTDRKEWKIGNCQIIHYTRIDPVNSQNILPHMGWVRSINPYNPEFSGHDWRPIISNTYTNAELLTLSQRQKPTHVL